jgi:hypothetical protein
VVNITAKLDHVLGIRAAIVYHSTGLDGVFQRVRMFDDGQSGDGKVGDGVYGAQISETSAGTIVRYYVEAIANDEFGTTTYMPAGATHDVYFYQVSFKTSSQKDIVINELMADNTSTVKDQNGEYDDWIELYNKSNTEVDVSGMFISDDSGNKDKYKIPDSTFIPANGYLIIWADEDGKQEGLYANFKLAASGEQVLLFDKDTALVDRVTFGAQAADKAYARVPNGTGPFVSQAATHNKANRSAMLNQDDQQSISIKINADPSTDILNLTSESSKPITYKITNMHGRTVHNGSMTKSKSIKVSKWPSGTYIIVVGNQSFTWTKN